MMKAVAFVFVVKMASTVKYILYFILFQREREREKG